MRLLLSGFALLVTFFCAAQSFRFNHLLKQTDIDDDGFILQQPTTRQIVGTRSMAGGPTYTYGVWLNFFDTLEFSQQVRLIPSQTVLAKISSSSVLVGRTAMTNDVLANTNLYTVNPGVLVEVPANTVLYLQGLSAPTTVLISTVSGAPLDINNRIRALNGGNLVRLPWTTKGIITVTGNKILFDPWQQEPPLRPTPLGFLNAIDENTTLPLELKDGRQTMVQATKVLTVPYRHFTLGVNTIPFRYRGRRVSNNVVLASGTVTTAFNLAFSIGHTWGFSKITTRARNDYAFTLGAFAGPSSVDLNPKTVFNPAVFEAGRTNPVLSYGLNAIFSRNGFGVLLALGRDRAYGRFGGDWIYNRKPWIGFGISASFPR